LTGRTVEEIEIAFVIAKSSVRVDVCQPDNFVANYRESRIVIEVEDFLN